VGVLLRLDAWRVASLFKLIVFSVVTEFLLVCDSSVVMSRFL
jgi:hypothetical protein